MYGLDFNCATICPLIFIIFYNSFKNSFISRLLIIISFDFSSRNEFNLERSSFVNTLSSVL